MSRIRTPADFEAAACEAAWRGGEVLRRRFREDRPISIDEKGLHDYVTDVDLEAEAAVVGYLRDRFPDHAVMSEEGAPELTVAPYLWVIDPLDGTTNFIHGTTPFAVSVALENEGALLAGAVHDPIHGETFSAHAGGGARLDGKPIRCSEPRSADQALIATGFPYRELSRLAPYLRAFEEFVRSTSGLRRAGSASIDLAYTACGRYDGFWEVGLSRWDIAAGILLVREAGGVVTDLEGGQSCLETGDVIAAGPGLYERMARVIAEAFA